MLFLARPSDGAHHLVRRDCLQIAFGYLLRNRFLHMLGLHQEVLRSHSMNTYQRRKARARAV